MYCGANKNAFSIHSITSTDDARHRVRPGPSWASSKFLRIKNVSMSIYIYLYAVPETCSSSNPLQILSHRAHYKIRSNPPYHLNRFLDAAEPASNASCSPRSHPSVLPSCAQQVQIIPIPSSNGTKPLIRRPCQSVYGSLSQNSASSSTSRLPA